jgi:hypothetical protein
MLGGRKITATHMGEMLEGSVAKCFPQRGILLPLPCCLIVVEVIEGMANIHWGMCFSHQRKIPKFCLTSSSGGFEYETMMVR